MSALTDRLDEIQARADAVEIAENAAEDAEMAGKNYALTVSPLSVSNALDATAADVPALIAALRAVESALDEADAKPGPDGERKVHTVVVRQAIEAALEVE